jgi:hypothetical protein
MGKQLVWRKLMREAGVHRCLLGMGHAEELQALHLVQGRLRGHTSPPF